MKQGAYIVAALMVLIGLVWMGQGVGLIPGSFMSGDIKWTFIGLVVVIAAGGLGWWANRRPVK